uniref:Uncharacterized protein n=1 Tax=Elaeophora elaphi TaxID=1147741 RepID=A0A0R3S0D7_9BILA
MASVFKVFAIFISLLLTIITCQEVTDEALNRHESLTVGKRAKFAFAKRYPSRFAFAKRYDEEDLNDYDKKDIRFESPAHLTRNFAFAKRVPYLFFA